MKSFFKKLAFVMALTMVVSAAAPAATAAHADEAGVSLQGTKTIVATYELEKAGATVDFSFQGAPSDWKTTYKWTSSNEAVATVDKAGIVTAVAAGTATITITAGADASYVQTVVVTVKAETPADYFEVEQVSTTAINLVFATEQNVKAEDLEFSMKFGDVYAVLPIKSVDVDGNVATVTVGDNHLIDGETYNFTYGTQSVDFVASVGEIASVAYTYFSDSYGDNVAYVSTEEEPTLVTLVPVFYDAQGVDVTAKYVEVEDGIVNVTGDLIVEYEIVNEDFDAYDFDSNGTIEFLKAAPAAIKILVSWTNIDGEEIVKPWSGVVIGTERSPLSVKVSKAGFLVPSWFAEGAVKAFQTNSTSALWDSAQTSWNLSDVTDLYFAAALTDNRGTKKLATGSDYDYGTFEFESSNTEIFDIDSDSGLLSLYKAGSASVLVYFVDLEGNRMLAGAQKLTIYPERYVSTYDVTTSTTVALGSTSHTGNVTLTAYDQYGSAIKLSDVNDITVEALYSSTPVDEITNITECTNWWCGSSNGHYHITFDAKDYEDDVDDSAYKTYRYRVSVDKEANDTLTTGSKNVSVKVMNVKNYADSLYAFWNGNAAAPAKLYYGVGGGASVDLRVDIYTNYSWNGLGNGKSGTIGTVSAYSNNGLYLGDLPTEFILPKYGVEPKDAKVGYVYYEITAPKKSVTASGSALYNSFNNWTVNDATSSTEDEAITLATSTNGFSFNFNTKNWVLDADLTEAAGEEVYVADLSYATTGSYTVNYYYVKSAGSSSFQKLGSATFSVTNSQPSVTFEGYVDESTTSRGIYLEDVVNDANEVVYTATTADDVAVIVKETLKFKYDGTTLDEITDWDWWKITTDEEGNVTKKEFKEKGYELIIDAEATNANGKPMYQIVENGKLRINWVRVRVKLEDWSNTYYEMDVNVGKTITTK